jgi:hypothetical protein
MPRLELLIFIFYVSLDHLVVDIDAFIQKYSDFEKICLNSVLKFTISITFN